MAQYAFHAVSNLSNLLHTHLSVEASVCARLQRSISKLGTCLKEQYIWVHLEGWVMLSDAEWCWVHLDMLPTLASASARISSRNLAASADWKAQDLVIFCVWAQMSAEHTVEYSGSMIFCESLSCLSMAASAHKNQGSLSSTIPHLRQIRNCLNASNLSR